MFYRVEYCFVLQKLASICTNIYQKKTFELYYPKITCNVILDFNNTKKICNQVGSYIQVTLGIDKVS